MSWKPSLLFCPMLALLLLGCGNLTERGEPQHVAFEPDGSLVVSMFGASEILDPTGKILVQSIPTPLANGVIYTPVARGVAMSADGSMVAVAVVDTVTVFATASGRVVATIADRADASPSTITAVALDSSGARLAVVTAAVTSIARPTDTSGHLRVFDVATQAMVLDVAHDPARAGNANWPGGVALSPDGAILYGSEWLLSTPTSAAGYFLNAWDVADGTRLWDVPVPSTNVIDTAATFILTLSADGMLLAGGAWDTDALYVWRTSDGSTRSTISDATTGLDNQIPDALGDIRFSPDATELLIAFPGAPVLLGIDGGFLRSFVPDTNIIGGVRSAALSADGARVASVFSSQLEIWNASDGAVLVQRSFTGQLD